MPKYVCDDCCAEFDSEDQFKPLREIYRLRERLDPGSVVPYGECLKCGAFVYGRPDARERFEACVMDRLDATRGIELVFERERIGLGRSVVMSAPGYGEKSAADGAGSPAMFDLTGGKFRVLVWADINQEGPTHVIDLEGARESARKPE